MTARCPTADCRFTSRAAAGLLALVCCWSATMVHAQGIAPAPQSLTASGAVNVTSQGISNIPALSLGRPAAIFDLAVRRGDVSFEPQFRFGLDGKPWSFLLWGRYRAVDRPAFRLTLGAHPGFSFRTIDAEVGGAARDLIQVRRYLGVDAAPVWTLNARTTIGGYYLYAHGIDFGAAAHTNLIAARASITDLPVAGRLVAQLAPQVYLLRTNGESGSYFATAVSVAPRGAPLSLGAFVNLPIKSTVTGGQRRLWNVSLTYTFR